MVVFPNCKINLGLSVKSRRPDGYHEIETVFYPAGWKDVLEIVRGEELKLFSTGLAIGTENNICLKAYHLLQRRFTLPPVHIHLHKVIPMGAGLGGGSADGAFALKLLNEKLQLGLTEDELLSLALELGSDCPFFIYNRPMVAEGRGEKMEDVQLNLERYNILIVYPGIHVSTADAFAGIQPQNNRPFLKEIIATPVREWKNSLFNDFEKTIFERYPAIAALKKWIYDNGALYASMSGSGSSVYGIFEDLPSTDELPPSYSFHFLPGKL